MNKGIDVFGYMENGEELIKLKEITLDCTLNDLEDIIDFLHYVRKTHNIE